jgi:Rrf2 family nitric oxide-sensitive transcriptional repressor
LRRKAFQPEGGLSSKTSYARKFKELITHTPTAGVAEVPIICYIHSVKVTHHTDYALRLLIYILTHPDDVVSARAVAELYGVSLNRMNKVSQHLVKLGLLKSTRGRGGWVKLSDVAREWRLGDLVRLLEPTGEIAQCEENSTVRPCRIAPVCHLRSIFAGGTMAFYNHLNGYKVEDLIAKNANEMRVLLSDVDF